MPVKTIGKKALAALCAAALCLGLFCVGMPVSAAGVAISQTIDSVDVGESITLSAGQAGATWTSSDPTVATVDENGVVTGRSMGKATITATYGGQSDSCVVSVGFLNGIDVSHHNSVDWDAVAASGVDFVMIRAGYGWENFPNQNDREFETNVRQAYEHGIPFGLYFYSYAGTESTPAEEDVAAEAAYFLREMELIQPYLDGMILPVAYDLEEPEQTSMSGDRLTGLVEIFANAIREEGYSTMVYTSDSVMRRLDLAELESQGIGFWNAYYVADDKLDFTKQMTIGSSQTNGNTGVVPDIWQYASDGRNPGVGGGNANTDLDLLYLDIDSAQTQLLSQSWPDVTVSGSTAEVSFAARTLYLEGYTLVKYRQGTLTQLAELPRCTISYRDTDYLPGDQYILAFRLNPMLAGEETVWFQLSSRDFNGDGSQNVLDVMALAQDAVGKITLDNYFSSDFTGDGTVDLLDVMEFARQFANRSVTG